MMHVEDVERRTSLVLKDLAGGLEVTGKDLDRIEQAWRQRTLTGPAAARTGAARWTARAVIAAAAAALVVGVVSLALRTTDRPEPARTPTTQTANLGQDELVGTWRPEPLFYVLWVFRADGTLENLHRPADLVDAGRPALGRYSVHGNELFVAPSAECDATVTLLRAGAGAMVMKEPHVAPACSLEFGDRWWSESTMTRLQPPGGTPFRSTYQSGPMSPVEWMSGLEGTWLLRGSTRVMAIVGTSQEAGRYVVIDDLAALEPGTGRHVVVDRGTVHLDGVGRVSLRSAQPACERTFTDVRTDYASLSAHLSSTQCGPLGGQDDTWIRLN